MSSLLNPSVRHGSAAVVLFDRTEWGPREIHDSERIRHGRSTIMDQKSRICRLVDRRITDSLVY
jgi:hypothetical protein